MGASTDDVQADYRVLMDEWLTKTLKHLDANDEAEYKM